MFSINKLNVSDDITAIAVPEIRGAAKTPDLKRDKEERGVVRV